MSPQRKSWDESSENRSYAYEWYAKAIINPWKEQLLWPSANEANVKFQMDIDSHTSLADVVVNFHVKFYECLILAEGRTNCSFQYLTEVFLNYMYNVQIRSWQQKQFLENRWYDEAMK